MHTNSDDSDQTARLSFAGRTKLIVDFVPDRLRLKRRFSLKFQVHEIEV